MRKAHICPKCDHREILRIAQVPDVLGDWADSERDADVSRRPMREAQSAALRIARLPNDSGTATGATVGIVRAFVCRSCGYTELYTDAPQDIPVDGEMVSIVRGPEKGGPYR